VCHCPAVADDSLIPPQTSLLVYGGIASWVALIGGLFVYGTGTSRVEQVVMFVVGALVLAEGIGLVTNWRGGADEVSDRIRSWSPSADDVFVRTWSRASFVRGNLGLLAIFLGAVCIWAAFRGPVHHNVWP
jgi:hypothetical protein